MIRDTYDGFIKNNIEKLFYLYIVLLLYICFGSFLAVYSIAFFDKNYINLLHLAFNNTRFITFFLLPIMLIIGTINYNLIETNDSVFLRLNTRKEYFKYHISSNFIISTYAYCCSIIITLIFVNFYASLDNVIQQSFFYDINNIISCLFDIIKIYLLIIFFQVLNVFLLKSLKNKVFVFVSQFILIIFIYNAHLISDLVLLKFILPSTYVGFEYIFGTFQDNLFYSILYFLLGIGIFYYLSRSRFLKKDIGV